MKPSSKPRHGNSEHSNRDNDDQHRAGDKRQIADQACPILDGIGKAVTQESSLSAPAPAEKTPREKKGTYLLARRTRSLSISYTPARSASFSTRITGPSSGRTQGHPLVAKSGSVAARKMAPAIRGTGVSGMPASSSLTGSPRIDVSFRLHKSRLFFSTLG